MELLDFDDSLFAEPNDRKSARVLPSYTAKCFFPEWYNSQTPKDSSELMMVHKYRADMAYRQGSYSQSLFHYRNCIDQMHSNNIAMLRDSLDGCSRCLVKMGQHDEACQLAKQVDTMAQSADHKTSSLLLLTKVHHASGQWMECRNNLHCLLTLHPANPDLWLRLSEVYVTMLHDIAKHKQIEPCSDLSFENKLNTNEATSTSTHTFQGNASLQKLKFIQPKDKVVSSVSESVGGDIENDISSTTSSENSKIKCFPNNRSTYSDMENDRLSQLSLTDSTIPEKEMCSLIDIENPAIAAATCFLMARMLLRAVQATIRGFALAENKRKQEQVTHQLEQLHVSDILLKSRHLFLQTQTRTLGEEDSSNMSCDIVKNLEIIARNFTHKWFSCVENDSFT